MLQDKVMEIYCLVDDLLKEMNHREYNKLILLAMVFQSDRTIL